MAVNGFDILSGVGHHAFMRFLTRYMKGPVREILNKMPAGLHREWHRFDDKFRQANNLPSIYHPKGERFWRGWLKQNPDGLNQLIQTQRRAIIEFIALKKREGVKIEGMLEAFDAAIK